MIKAIIFDYDDTLVRTMASKWEALKETGRRFYGLAITDDHIKQFWGKPFQEMLEGVLMHADTFAGLQRSYGKVYDEFPMRAYSDAPQVVAKLAEQYLVGVLTASDRNLVVYDLTMLGFPIDKMTYIQTSEDTTAHKPDPAVFEPVLRHLAEKGITRDEVLYIGDAVKDYAAARDAGLHFLGVTHGTTSEAEFRSAGAKTISNLSQLLAPDLILEA